MPGLVAATPVAFAQGYYEYLPYQNNDPFTFCTIGVPEHCWAPIDASTGTYTVTNPKCFNATSATTYARVCPKAFNNAGNTAGGDSAQALP